VNLIYLITNKINDKKYIGQTRTSINKRWSKHKTDSKFVDRPLYRAIRKYGIENFTISIIESVDESVVDDRETYWIDYYKSSVLDYGYNLESGGNKYKVVSAETKIKLSISHMGEKNSMFGKNHSEESKLLISANKTGKLVGEKSGRSKFSNADVLNIRNLYATGKYSYGSLASSYGVNKSTIMRIIKNITYSDA
jgi:group I intron endonuclease